MHEPTIAAMRGLSRARMAALIGADIPDGTYVNLGIGMPTMVADHIPAGREVILHSENGILGMWPLAEGAVADPDLINPGKQPVQLATGASITDHVVSFAMMRGGHIDVTVLGAFQVSQRGDLANWDTGASDSIPAVGGAMDLVAGAKHVYIMMEHVDRDGQPKIVAECSYPLTGAGVVERIYTNLAVIDVTPQGLRVRAMLAGLTLAQLQSVTGAPLRLADDCVPLQGDDA